MSVGSKIWIVVGVVALGGIALFAYDDARSATRAAAVTTTASAGSGKHMAAADGTPINACALLSGEEVAAAVGAKVIPGERRDEGDVVAQGQDAPPGTYSSTCFWRFSADDAREDNPTLPMGGKRFAILNAMIWPKPEDAATFLQSFHDAFKNDIIPNDPVEIKLGDEGLWWGDGTAVRKGNISIGMSVFLQNGDKASQRKMEEALARKVIPRLSKN